MKDVIPKPPKYDSALDWACDVCDTHHHKDVAECAKIELRLLLALVRANVNYRFDPDYAPYVLDLKVALDNICEQAPHLLDAARKAGEEGTP